jgi:hypothetical protein
MGLSLVAALAGTPTQAAVTVDPRAHKVALSGEINDEAVRAVKAIIEHDPTTKVLVVRSAGGAPGPTIGLASLLRSRRMTLEVDTYCVGACAQNLFIAAAEVNVPKGALVAFHNEIVAGAELMRAQSLQPPSALQAAADADVEFYQSLGLPSSLLVDQFTGLDPICLDPATHRIISRAQLWVPPRAWIEQARPGKNLSWWPEAQADVEKAVARMESELAQPSRVRFGGSKDFKIYRERLSKGHECPV